MNKVLGLLVIVGLFAFKDFSLQVGARNYYFSAAGNDATGDGTISNPYQSITKVNSLSFIAGDSVLFKRGDTFSGTLTIANSGASGTPITYGAYGTGAKPVITGLSTLTGWTSLGNGIWESAVNTSLRATLSTLLLNDTMKAMGRYPNDNATNKGYLTYQSGSNGSLTSNAIASAPNFIGAEVVVRLNRFYTDRCAITGQTASTITYTSQSGSSPTSNFGFFFQNSPLTLDKFGEWYYDAANKKVQVYLGNSSAYTIKASTIDTLVKAVNRSYVTLDNLALQGANDISVAVNGGSNFTVQNCDITYSGRDAITIAATNNFKADGNFINYSNSRGFNGFQSNSGPMTVTNNTIRNTGTFAGMGWKRSKDGVLNGIEVTTNGSLVQGNTVVNSGYIGIRYYGDNTVVRDNYVDSFCFVKDDGGGVYTWNGSNVNHTGMKVLNNIVKNGLGATAGTNSTNSEAEGIYMDDFANGIDIEGNTVMNTRRGIYLHDGSDVIMRNNILTNNYYGLITYWQNRGRDIQNITFASNAVTSPASQLAIYLNYVTTPTVGPLAIGTIDSNTYCRPASEATTTAMFSVRTTATTNYTFNQWQSTYSKDAHSTRSSCDVVTPPPPPPPGGGKKKYFFAQSGNDANTTTQALSSSTPWKSISKLTTLAKGDTAALRCNDTFPGSVVLTQGIVITSYGTGWKPLISGFVNPASWTNLGGGIYESNALATSSSVNMVVINGKPYAMGRYPNADAGNSGYLTYNSHTSTSITDNTKPALIDATFASGGYVVVRGNHYGIERQPITAVSGNTISFASALEYDPTDGHGYFVENSVKTLDQFGEWYYNPTTKKIDVYFGSAGPAGNNVQVSAKDVIINPQADSTTITNVRFEGANQYAIWDDNAGRKNFNVTDCKFAFSGIDHISFGGRADVNISNSMFAWANGNGVCLSWHDDRPSIDNSNFRNIGLFPGMYIRHQNSSNRYGYGVFIQAQSGYFGVSLTNSNFNNIGYSPIFLNGDSQFVYHNMIDSFCSVLDDGGGIYTGNAGASTTIKSIVIKENIVTNGIGAAAGTTGGDSGAEGIYLDDNTINTVVQGNTVANVQHSGIYLHNARKNTIKYNTFYNNAQQLAFQHDHVGTFAVDSNIVRGNQLFSLTPSQLIISMQKASDFNESFATFASSLDSNNYCAPFKSESNIIYTNWFGHAGSSEIYYNLAGWQSFSGKDQNTIKTPISLSDAGKVVFRFTGKLKQRVKVCADCVDLQNTDRGSGVDLNPYSSIILLRKN
jgi:parallel beta-helix repeat protein